VLSGPLGGGVGRQAAPVGPRLLAALTLRLHPDPGPPANTTPTPPWGADTPVGWDLCRSTAAGWSLSGGCCRTWIAFAVAVACCIYLATVAGSATWWCGASLDRGRILYTGGPRPTATRGLGVFPSFSSFGLVGGQRLYYVGSWRNATRSAGASICDWLPLATSIIVVNNVRDLETDRRAGKITLRCGWAGHAGNLYLAAGARLLRRPPIALVAGESSLMPLIGLSCAAAVYRADADSERAHLLARAELVALAATCACSAYTPALHLPSF